MASAAVSARLNWAGAWVQGGRIRIGIQTIGWKSTGDNKPAEPAPRTKWPILHRIVAMSLLAHRGLHREARVAHQRNTGKKPSDGLRTVIDNDQFPLSPGLPQEAVQGERSISVPIGRGHNGGDQHRKKRQGPRLEVGRTANLQNRSSATRFVDNESPIRRPIARREPNAPAARGRLLK
jgi:hypothetical protein